MKCACVVLSNKISTDGTGLHAVIHAFQSNGFPFEEIRVLAERDEMRVKSALTSLKAEFDALVLLCEKMALSKAKKYLVGVFDDSALRGNFGGACIYETEKACLFLLSADNSPTGKEYALNACVSFLQQKSGVRCDKLVLRAIGASRARISALLAEAQAMGGAYLQCYHTYRYGEDVVEISYDQATPKMLVDDVLRLFADGLGDTVYALNDVTLEQQLVHLLKLRRRKISVAESFTGGGIARRITSVSGASEVYFEGLNTYDSRAKIKRLGVLEQTINTMGAVSEQTAYEMAYGLLKTGDCDVSLATTGLAGPHTDGSALPVGLCYLAVGFQDKVFVYRYKFDGTREEITQTAINYALYLAYKQLKDL